ncbi:hypothetical protein FISHEDRAFT_69668 [Fistulina hepatica ATCC 64428]|uniref:CCHC-type domain-containing protein n=1 Tax=Fistulina hepatica ATCC 64428 TaxID=1128425 RepID=A0A0D7AMU9_9AGAR|nr:hypothetical protein FISHEDRAFT_69668 [Fistulina hepatica ATCC 64428]
MSQTGDINKTPRGPSRGGVDQTPPLPPESPTRVRSAGKAPSSLYLAKSSGNTGARLAPYQNPHEEKSKQKLKEKRVTEKRAVRALVGDVFTDNRKPASTVKNSAGISTRIMEDSTDDDSEHSEMDGISTTSQQQSDYGVTGETSNGAMSNSDLQDNLVFYIAETTSTWAQLEARALQNHDPGLVDVPNEMKTKVSDLFVRMRGRDWHAEQEKALTNLTSAVEKMDNMLNGVTGRLAGIEEKQDTAAHSVKQALEKVEDKIAQHAATLDAAVTTAPRHAATTHSLGPTYKPTKRQGETGAANPTQQQRKQSDPMRAHHPARLIVELPEDSPNYKHPEIGTVVQAVNDALGDQDDSQHISVRGAFYNKKMNCILIAGEGNTAKELMAFQDRFAHVFLCYDTQGSRIAAHEDTKWVKVQVDGVPTGMQGYGVQVTSGSLHAATDVHENMSKMNPALGGLHFTQPTRWLRTNEELSGSKHSSVVFATNDIDKVEALFKAQSRVFVYGKPCTFRRFADQPPAIQCKQCWLLGHTTTQCKDVAKCRLCGSMEHGQLEHKEECTSCAQQDNCNMEGDQASQQICTHNLRCVNCEGEEGGAHACDSRRCPARVAMYGSARDHERAEKKQEHQAGEWTAVKANGSSKKKRRTAKAAAQHTQGQSNAQGMSPGRFATLEDDIEGPSVAGILKIAEQEGHDISKIDHMQLVETLSTTATTYPAASV